MPGYSLSLPEYQDLPTMIAPAKAKDVLVTAGRDDDAISFGDAIGCRGGLNLGARDGGSA